MLTGVVCLALTAAGLVLAGLTAWRRRFRAATRLAALSLLPVGLDLARLIKVAVRIGRAVGDWAADLVFKPSVWLGFALLALAVLLFLASRLGRGRSAGQDRRAARSAAGEAVAPAGAAPALGGPRPAEVVPARRKKAAADDPLAEFGDVEEILRRRGI